jgi:predicted RecA/RadA family phage recombinase
MKVKLSGNTPGLRIDYTSDAALEAGEIKFVGGLVGIVPSDTAASVKNALDIEGAFWFPKATDEAISVGQLYLDTDNEVATATATGNSYIGHCILAAAEADTYVLVKINTPRDIPVTEQTHIADPDAMAALTIADPAAMDAITGASPAACADMTTDLTGVDTGTDMTAAQAAQIVADLAALKTAIDANKAAIDANIADILAAKTAIDANNAQIDAAADDLAAAKTAVDANAAAIGSTLDALEALNFVAEA